MTDEAIESISPPRPGAQQVAAPTGPGSGHVSGLAMAGGVLGSGNAAGMATAGHVPGAGVAMAGSAPTGNPFLTPMWSIPPEIQAIPARTPGFAPRQGPAGGEQGALRPAAVSEVPPVFQEPPAHEVPWDAFEQPPQILEGSRRRNNLVIGASAAAAVAVAIGAISLTHQSAPSAASNGRSGAFGPGAGDPTEGPHNNGQPLDGSTSAPAGNQTTDPAPTDPPVVAATSTPPPKPNPATPKPPPATSKAPVCTGWHTTHIPAQDGKGFAAAALALRSGPYANCGAVGSHSFSSGQHMYIWCHAVNGYGSTWVYGRMDDTSAPGWQAATALKPGAKLGPVC